MRTSLSLLDVSGFTIKQLYSLWRSQCSVLTELPIWNRAALSVSITWGPGVCNAQTRRIFHGILGSFELDGGG